MPDDVWTVVAFTDCDSEATGVKNICVEVDYYAIGVKPAHLVEALIEAFKKQLHLRPMGCFIGIARGTVLPTIGDVVPTAVGCVGRCGQSQQLIMLFAKSVLNE